MTAPVYVIESLESVVSGQLVVLDGAEGRHASTVRRAKVGERIDVVNGRGYRACCQVNALGKNEVTLAVIDAYQEEEILPRITLVQALAKGGRDEQAVETATEYGVSSFIPWASERSIASWKGKEEKGIAKWENTAIAAAKQSRRSWIPTVEPLNSTAQLCERISAEKPLVFLCHENASEPLTQIYSLCAERAAERGADIADIWVIVGPEGGITEKELEDLSAVEVDVVRLGPHVLRSSSAGPYAVATIFACISRIESTR